MFDKICYKCKKLYQSETIASYLCQQCKKYKSPLKKKQIQKQEQKQSNPYNYKIHNYKKICTICKIEFLTHHKNQNICSKLCRKSIKKTKKYHKCIICGWDATIDTHHENGNEYAFCPNHHSLLTRGKQTLEEVLKGTLYSLRQIKDYNYSTIEIEPKTYNIIYEKLKESNIKDFQYKDIINATGWKRERVKKYILGLVKLGRIEYVIKNKGGRGKQVKFKLA